MKIHRADLEKIDKTSRFFPVFSLHHFDRFDAKSTTPHAEEYCLTIWNPSLRIAFRIPLLVACSEIKPVVNRQSGYRQVDS